MSVRTTAGSIGLVILILSAIVHFATYLQIDFAAQHPAVWALFPSAMILHIFACIRFALRYGPRPPIRVSYNATLARMPKWTWVALLVFLIYTLAIFALNGPSLSIPQLVDGRYITSDHGRIFEFTYEQTQLMILHRTRIFSGFCMWISLVWTLYFLTARLDTLELNNDRFAGPPPQSL